MKKLLSVALGLSLGAALLVPNFASAQDKKGEKKPAPKKTAAKKVTCPVSGDPVKDITKADKAEYKGKTYYFCCPDCKPKFDKDPAKYAKAAEKKGDSKGKKKGEGKGEKKGEDKK